MRLAKCVRIISLRLIYPQKMKIKAVLLMASAATIMACSNNHSTNMEIKTEADKFSYSIGMDIGKNIKDQSIDSLNVDLLLNGLRDILDSTGEPKFTFEESQQEIQSYLTKLREEKAATAKNAGASFLAENAKKEGVVVTESGLQYEILKEGNGPKPSAEDEVTVHYHGTLTDGTVFDSSVERGEPATFPLNRVIQGWTEGVQLMSVGSKYRFTIPSELAYGDQGAGQLIQGGATLVFDVELLKIGNK